MNTALRDAIAIFQKEKGISEDLLIDKICLAVATAAKKEFGGRNNIICEIDSEYELHLFHRRTVVEEVLDPDNELTPEEAAGLRENAVPGDVIDEPLRLDNLGRIAAQSVKHIVRQGVREIEREQILRDFSSKEKEVVTAKVVSVNPVNGDATVEIAGNEALLPKKDQIPGETLKAGDLVKIYISKVLSTDRGPKVMLSRIDPDLVRHLFEQEVPEIGDGSVEIRGVAREAGSRTKIAVYSRDENVDPVGACIGPKGSRVNAVIGMLGGEKIDIIKYSDDPRAFIGAALSPAEIVEVEILSDAERSCRVTVPESQLSLAIGNKGQNARLAAHLTKWKIDIKPYYGIKI